MRQILSLVLVLGTSTIAGTSAAGAVGGVKSSRDTVMGHSTDTYTVVFEKGSPARVTVNGDGSTDLDCYVQDSGGNIIDSDTDATDYCLLSWSPAWTGKFTIQIRNLGSKPNEYQMRTN